MDDNFEATNFDENDVNIVHNDNNQGWQKVTYAKRQRKNPIKQLESGKVLSNGSVATGGAADNIFQSLEKESEERRRRLEAQRAAIALGSEIPVKSKGRSDDDDEDDSDAEGDLANKVADEKKVKQKKPKKPKVTVAEAAAKIDSADLAAFLVDISESYESQQDIQMMRFADYFGRAFSGVGAAQFPWSKMFRESAVAKIADVPLNHISEAVYKTSADWINHRSLEALHSFTIWCLDSILSDLSSQHASVKGLKKAAQPTSKSQVAIFAVLAMILKRKPDVLISLLPTLRENTKYQGQDKLPVIIWMIVQACHGDLSVGFFVWTHYLLPTVGGKSCNPQSRDLILQLVERILSAPKARTVLVNGAIRKGERLLTPADFDVLLRATFPVPSARVKATERFQAIYPVLKEVALAGPPGSKAMKQASQQMVGFSINAAGEGNPELAKEATDIFIWCLGQNPECFKLWDKLYLDNLEASVSALKKLSEEWKEFSGKQSSFESLKETLKGFRNKNEKALGDDDEEGARVALFKEANKYSKSILAKLSRGGGCAKGFAFVVIALGVGAVIMSPTIESVDWNKLSAMVTSHLQSF